jgi:hypothetical protein
VSWKPQAYNTAADFPLQMQVRNYELFGIAYSAQDGSVALEPFLLCPKKLEFHNPGIGLWV